MLSTRAFGTTGITTTTVGFGAWAIGGTWAEVTETAAKDRLHAALDAGMTFIDTADVYGDGRSQHLLADALGHLPATTMAALHDIYDRLIAPHVHDRR